MGKFPVPALRSKVYLKHTEWDFCWIYTLERKKELLGLDKVVKRL